MYELFRDHTNLLEYAIAYKVREKSKKSSLDVETLRHIYRDPLKMLTFCRSAIGFPEFKLMDPFIYLEYESQKLELKTKIIGAYHKINTADRYTEYSKFLYAHGLHEVHVDMSAPRNPVHASVLRTIKSIIHEHPPPMRISKRNSIKRVQYNILKDYYEPFAEVFCLRTISLEDFCMISNFKEIIFEYMQSLNRKDFDAMLKCMFNIYILFPEKRNSEIYSDLEFSPKVKVSYNVITPLQEKAVSISSFWSSFI